MVFLFLINSSLPESSHYILILQKNWNLFSVNVVMAGTGLYQLSRKLR